MIYLDYAATTPMSKRALNTFNEVAIHYYGNSSSLHDIGASANFLLEKSRETIATMINGHPEGVYFTSGGSESNYLAIHSLLKAHSHNGKHIITTKLEHSSILNIFEALREDGYEITYLPVNNSGEVKLDSLAKAIRKDTIFASIQHVNSEIGTIQNLQEIGKLLKEKNILFHSDCVQSFGKLPIDVTTFNIDSISISSHKIYGPKGVGLCYIHPNIAWKSLIPNTTHEKGFRPGTVNVPGIVSFVSAAEEMLENTEVENIRIHELRQFFLKQVEKNNKIIIEGSNTNRLDNIIGFRIKGVEGQYTMLECNRQGIAISTGSACSIGKQAPSQALLAVGRSSMEAKEFARISLGKMTTVEDIEKVTAVITKFE